VAIKKQNKKNIRGFELSLLNRSDIYLFTGLLRDARWHPHERARFWEV